MNSGFWLPVVCRIPSDTETVDRGRHSGRNSCDLPYLPAEQVEDAIGGQWDGEAFPAPLVAALRERLTADLRAFNATTEDEQQRLPSE